MALSRVKLKRRRELLGFTQESLADFMAVDRRTVARWEADGGPPRPWQRPKLAEALGVTLEELQELLDVHVDGKPSQAATLRDLASHPERVNLASVALLRVAQVDLSRRYDQSPSAGLVAEAGEQLADLRRLAQFARSGRLQRELLSLQAEGATLMGQLVWDASQRRDQGSARSYYDQAISIARHLREPSLESHALLRQSYIDLYGRRQPADGLGLALTAAARAADSSPALSGLALLHVGEAHAMLGSARECEQALDRAQHLLAAAQPTDAGAELISPSQFGRLTGACYLELGDHARAQDRLGHTAAEIQQRPKLRALVLANLALSYIRTRELDAGLTALNAAIDDLEETRGGGGMTLVARAVRELRPWRAEPPVQDVQDRLLSIMDAA